MLSEMKLRGLWRRIRSKVGIRSSRVAIRHQLPWYIRFAGWGLMMGVAGAVAWWLVDNSYRITGFNRKEAAAQITKLTQENERLRQEVITFKSHLNEREGQLNVEKAAQQELAKNVSQLQEENAGIKEDLGFLRNIMSAGSVPEGLVITNLKVEADAQPNEYRYRMLLTMGGQRRQDFKGKVQVIARAINGTQVNTLSFPDDAALKMPGNEIEFKYYRKVDGRIKIPLGTQLKSIQIRVLGLPGYDVRSTKTLNL